MAVRALGHMATWHQRELLCLLLPEASWSVLAKALAPRSRSVSKCRQAWHGPAWSGKDTMQLEGQVYAAASTAAYPCLSHWVVVPQIPPTAWEGH